MFRLCVQVMCSGVTVEHVSDLEVQDLWSFLDDAFSDQGSAGSHNFHGNGTGRGGPSLQPVMIDHLNHRPFQVTV